MFYVGNFRNKNFTGERGGNKAINMPFMLWDKSKLQLDILKVRRQFIHALQRDVFKLFVIVVYASNENTKQDFVGGFIHNQ